MIDYLFLVLVAALCLCMLDTGVFPSLWAFNRLLKEGAALAQPPPPPFFFHPVRRFLGFAALSLLVVCASLATYLYFFKIRTHLSLMYKSLFPDNDEMVRNSEAHALHLHTSHHLFVHLLPLQLTCCNSSPCFSLSLSLSGQLCPRQMPPQKLKATLLSNLCKRRFFY